MNTKEMPATAGFRVTVKDLVKLGKELQSKVGYRGQEFPDKMAELCLIDCIRDRQSPEFKVGPKMTVIANDDDGYLWHMVEPAEIVATLAKHGWVKSGESTERGRIMCKGKPLCTYYRHKDEAYMLRDKTPDCLRDQFVFGMVAYDGAIIEVVHCDIEYLMRHGKPAGVAGLVWQVMEACPSVMAIAASFTEEDKAIDMVYHYLYNRHGGMLTARNIKKIIALENKGAKAPVRDVMKPRAKLRKRDLATEPDARMKDNPLLVPA